MSLPQFVSWEGLAALPTRPYSLVDGTALLQTMVTAPGRSYSLTFGRPGKELDPLACVLQGRIEVFAPQLGGIFVVPRMVTHRSFFGREKFQYPLYCNHEGLGGYRLSKNFDDPLSALSAGISFLNRLAADYQRLRGRSLESAASAITSEPGQTPDPRSTDGIDDLECFARRLQWYGIGIGEEKDEGYNVRVCGQIAGLFAKLGSRLIKCNCLI
jgi:hypothetical protein